MADNMNKKNKPNGSGLGFDLSALAGNMMGGGLGAQKDLGKEFANSGKTSGDGRGAGGGNRGGQGYNTGGGNRGGKSHNTGGGNRPGGGHGGAYNARRSTAGPMANSEYRHNGTFMHVHAPYNFVSLWDTPWVYREGIPAYNAVDEELISGEISYTLEAKTPVFIHNGVKDGEEANGFYRNSRGTYAIPGSSVRGMIRSNVQVLSFSNLYDDVDDPRLMFRDVTGGKDKARYNTIIGTKPVPFSVGATTANMTIPTAVEAGYIQCKNGKYRIYRCRQEDIPAEFGKMNYYVLNERHVIHTYNKAHAQGKESPYDWFFKNGNILQHETSLQGDFVRSGIERRRENTIIGDDGAFIKYTDRNRRVHYKGNMNLRFMPVYREISYEVRNKKDITAVGSPEQFSHHGWMLITGIMQEKKVIYIIPEMDKDHFFTLPQKAVDAFRIDYNKRETTLTFDRRHRFRNDDRKKKELKAFFDLPEEGKTKPVFYIGTIQDEAEGAMVPGEEKLQPVSGVEATGETDVDTTVYFGFTPRLRLFYDYSMAETLRKGHRPDTLDFTKALFGYSNLKKGDKTSSRKSRISFTDAILVSGEQSLNQRAFPPGSPKPDDYYNYLQQTVGSPVKSYNDKDFKIRGVKQYWLHQEAEEGVPVSEGSSFQMVVTPLPEKSLFKGKIRFHNLKKEELGLLMWAVCLEKNSCMNIGMAKAYGYGSVKLQLNAVRKVNSGKAYNFDTLALDPFETVDMDTVQEWIDCYKNGMSMSRLNGKSIDAQLHIREFFAMKDGKQIPESRKTTYMSLEEFQDQRRDNAVLLKPADVLGPSV